MEWKTWMTTVACLRNVPQNQDMRPSCLSFGTRGHLGRQADPKQVLALRRFPSWRSRRLPSYQRPIRLLELALLRRLSLTCSSEDGLCSVYSEWFFFSIKLVRNMVGKLTWVVLTTSIAYAHVEEPS